jgi:hypothetical protein
VCRLLYLWGGQAIKIKLFGFSPSVLFLLLVHEALYWEGLKAVAEVKQKRWKLA